MRDVVREITKMGRTRLIHVNTGGGRRAAGGGVRGAGCGVRGAGCGVRGAGIRRSTTNAMAGLLVVPPPAARRPPPGISFTLSLTNPLARLDSLPHVRR